MKNFIDRHIFIWPLLGTMILWTAVGIVSGQLTMNQLFSCSKLASFTLLLALAQMIVVTSGEGAIDLSQIYILTLCAYISCDLMNRNILIGLAVAALAGAACGFINGSINVFLKIPAMVTTLATGYIVFTLILIAAPHMKTLPAPLMVRFINLKLWNIPMLTVVCILIALVLAVLLYKTKYGKNLHAVGQNRLASRFSGIAVGNTVIAAFTLGGILCSIAGVLCGAFIGGAFQDMGSTYFLPSIAATFIGGTAASGGKSNVLGVCLGALMMSFMTTFLNAANLAPGIQRLIQGIFLVLILVASVTGSKKKK